ncbi:hypothetical protein BDZ45DRAFT_353474 [Acephala macrosclerotiorum]|nr:hypothetical protein BDZ45DRAFT_353474 [Acephala macrosclerotiorum]
MEMLRARSVSVVEAQHITEWPKVPQLSIKAAARIEDDQTEPEEQPNIEHQIPDLQEKFPNCSDAVPSVLEDSRTTRNTNEPDQPQSSKSPQTQLLGRPWSRIKRLTLKRSLWPDPHLSTGTKCSRIGDNECWEAIGPAQALFAQISQLIGELLDTRVEEIEEGEPVAGNILTYGMYMIGRDLNTARPTLIVTCQRPKPRRRAIKFIKESEILKGHPKIALAESSVVPMALGRNYLRLLSGRYFSSSTPSTIWTPRRDTTTAPSTSVTASSSQGLSPAALGGIIGGAVFFLVAILIAAVVVIRRLNKVVKAQELASSRTGSSSRPRSGHGGHNKPSMVDINAMSVDPLMIYGSEVSGSIRRREMNENHANSPPIFMSPFSSRSPPLMQYPRGYNSVASSEYSSSQSRSEFSGGSTITSTSSYGHVGYFDLPPQSGNRVSFIASQGQRPNQREIPSIKINDVGLPVTDAMVHCTALYGMPVSSTATGKTASLGGVLVSNSRCFGLTVRHSFFEAGKTTSRDTIESPPTSCDNNHEFAFDSDEEEEVSEVDVSDDAITSQASVSTAPSISRISSTTSGSSESERGISSSIIEIDTTHGGQSPESSPIPRSSAEPTEVSKPFATSTEAGQDWALIELSETSVLEAKNAVLKDNSLNGLALPQRLASKPTKDTSIVAIKGCSGLSKGILSPSMTMMKLPHSRKFHEVWIVRLDGPLAQGDSGSWVIDGTTGDLYGHIVAGVPEAGLAYILPAYKTFQEIEEVLGSKPTLMIRPLPHGGDYHPSNRIRDRIRVSETSSMTMGQRPPDCGRNWSNESDQSQVSEVSSAATEPGAENGERSSLLRFMSRLVGRRRTIDYSPVVLTGGPVRTDWLPSTMGGLGLIPEAGESMLEIGESHDIPDVRPQALLQDISLMDQEPGFRST